MRGSKRDNERVKEGQPRSSASPNVIALLYLVIEGVEFLRLVEGFEGFEGSSGWSCTAPSDRRTYCPITHIHMHSLSHTHTYIHSL